MAKSKKPTGLTITRNRRTFTLSWKCGTTDYDDGQDAYVWEGWTAYNKNSTTMGTSETDLNPGKTTWAKTHPITLSNYYPSTNKQLQEVGFRVRGNREKKKGMKSDPTWSEWASKTFKINPPYTPVLTEALDQSDERTTIFSWSCTQSDSNSHIFKDFEWESVRTKNGAAPNWSSPQIRHTANGIDPDTGGSDTGTETISQQVFTWAINKDGGFVTIRENSDSVYANTTDTYTRWFRVRSRGPGGTAGGEKNDGWVVEKHVYGTPHVVSTFNKQPTATATSGNSNKCITLGWDAYSPYKGKKKEVRPTDYVKIQYCIQSPTVTVTSSDTTSGFITRFNSTIGFNLNEASWTDAPGGIIPDTSGWDKYSFYLDTAVPTNKTVFVRVNATHDLRTTNGQETEVKNSRSFLDSPTGLHIDDGDYDEPGYNKILIDRPTNNSGIPNSFTAIYYRSSSNAKNEEIVGIVPWGQDTGTMIIRCPKWNDTDSPGLGMQTHIGSYTCSIDGVSGLPMNYTINSDWSSNGIDWAAGQIPLPPNLKVDKFKERPYDTIEATWDWKWSEANAAELSWSDKNDAWMSTGEPSTYIVNGVRASRWHITDLAPQTWWVRCRLLMETGDGTNYGAYSKAQSITLSTLPDAPGLNTDTPKVPVNGTFTVYWSYYNADGTKPSSAEFGWASVNNGVITYPSAPESGMQFEKTTYDQKQTFNVSTLGWASGSTHYMCVRVISESGQVSDWSYPLEIAVIPALNASISGTLINSQILTSLPLTVTVSGSGTDGTATAIITRRDSYVINRPDDSTDDGFEGEIIAVASRDGSGEITINRDILIGSLDDGAWYTIQGVVTDSYGQTARTQPVDFTVAWANQAQIPSATITVDNDHLATLIAIDSIQDAQIGDSVDIYRLSTDKPERIYTGASFGETYVDPYPALGEFGGHRIVYVTKDGDYITEDNTLAIVDFPDEDDEEVVDRIDYFGAIIDFGSDQIRLPYNIELSNSWHKDFTEVKYLGGSVQGYWNKAVSRSGSVKTSVVIEEDIAGPDTMRALRRLATWPGICHVRTPDGSSYSANIDVTEDRENKWVKRLASVTLNITRIDSQTEDGMTYDEWLGTL